MADISAEIAAFKNAAYGEDVRDSMVSLANKLNKTVQDAADNASESARIITNYNTRLESAELSSRKFLSQQIYFLGNAGQFFFKKIKLSEDIYYRIIIRWTGTIVHKNLNNHGFISQMNVTCAEMINYIGDEYKYVDDDSVEWISIPDISYLAYNSTEKIFLITSRDNIDGITYIPLLGNTNGALLWGLYFRLLTALNDSKTSNLQSEILDTKYAIQCLQSSLYISEAGANVSVKFINGLRYLTDFYTTQPSNIRLCLTMPIWLSAGDTIHIEYNTDDTLIQHAITSPAPFDSGWINDNYDFVVEYDNYYNFPIRFDGDSPISPKDADVLTYTITHTPDSVKIQRNTRALDLLKNYVIGGIVEVPMMLGGIYFYDDGVRKWQFTSITTMVCTPLSYHLFLPKGTTIRLTDYTDAQFYIGRRNSETGIGEYLSGWLHSDFITDVDGDYGILITNLNRTDISSNYQDYIDLLEINIPDIRSKNNTSIYFSKKKQEASIFKMQASSGDCVDCAFKAMLISDVHNAWDKMKNVVDICNDWGRAYIETVINSGDTAPFYVTDDVSQYYAYASDLTMSHLTVLGNHDVWDTSRTPDSDKTKAYSKFIKPIVNQQNIVQPSNAEANGLSYYYADFTNTRVICLDCMYYDSNELNWFKAVLSDSITNDKIVLCVSHYGFSSNNVTNIKCNWSPKLQYIPASDSSYDALSMDLADAVDDFIDNGGTFICWLFGHTHCNMISKLNSDHHNQLNIWLPSNANRQVRLLKSNNPEAYNYNVMTYMTVDTYEHSVRFMRIGANLHTNGVEHNGVSLDYRTGELNGCW